MLVCVAALGPFSAVAGARADPPEDAALIQEGLELRRQRRDTEALQAFSRALAIGGSVEARAQVGFAEQALGRWIEAERELSTVASAAEDPWTAKHLDVLDSALTAIRTHLAWLEVEVNVPGAELFVDGASAGPLPNASPVRVVAGSIAIEVRAPGFLSQQRVLHLAPQTHAREIMTLVRTETVSPAPPIEPCQATAEAPPAPVLPRASSVVPTEVQGAERTAAWISAATAAALGVGALTAAIVRESDLAIYNNDGRCFYGGETRDQRCGSYRSAAATAEVLAIVGAGAFAAASSASAILFVLSSRARHRADTASVQCGFGLGLRCTGRF